MSISTYPCRTWDPSIYTHGATILCNAVRCLVARYAKDALDTRYIFSSDCLHLSVLVAMLLGCHQNSYFLKSRHHSLELLCTGKHYFPDKRGIGCGLTVCVKSATGLQKSDAGDNQQWPVSPLPVIPLLATSPSTEVTR